MKRAFRVTIFAVIIMAFLFSFSINTQVVQAQNNSNRIQKIEHQVEVLYSGHVILREVIHVTGSLSSDFLIGFPSKFGSAVLKGIAFDESRVLPMSLGVQFAGGSGLYGAKVSFPSGSPQDFTVIFVLSNSLFGQDAATNSVDCSLEYPAYPSLSIEAELCEVSLLLPSEAAANIAINKNDGVVYSTEYSKVNLPAYTHSIGEAAFSIPPGKLQIISIKNLDRRVEIGPTGNLRSFDTYKITNESPNDLNYFEIDLPIQASLIAVRDEFGRILSTDIVGSSSTTVFINTTLLSPLKSGESASFLAEHDSGFALPGESSQFILNFDLFPDFNYFVDVASVTFIPPEGARFIEPQISSIDSSTTLTRETFQETLSIRREGVSKIDPDFSSIGILKIVYDFHPLWISFRPTLWMWIIVLVGAVAVFIWKRPRVSTKRETVLSRAYVGLSPDQVRSFVDAYKEKSRLTSELRSLESRAQKGKIPRRRYKVQRKSFEVRLDTVSKNINDFKATFRSAGGLYEDLVRQLDLAETELDEIEMNITNVEAQQKRGAISLEAYKKAIVDYQKRKEKAETTINGILLRLREEIH